MRILVLFIMTLANAQDCKDVSFDLSNIDKAIALYKHCTQNTEKKTINKIKSKFLSGWTELAVKEGVASALKCFKNDEVRAIIVPDEDWRCILRKMEKLEKGYKKLSFMSILMILIFAIDLILLIILVILIIKKRNCICTYMWCKDAKKKADSQTWGRSNTSICNDKVYESSGLLRLQQTNCSLLNKSYTSQNRR